MKILSGSLKSHPFEQPKSSSVRPFSDKVRAAIFDVCGSVEDLVVLDVYAGSGAAGFEALSRGAAMVEAIEGNPSVARVIQANIKALNIDWGYVLHVMKLETWLALPSNQSYVDRPQARYDLIISDPPYAKLDAELLGRLTPFLNSEGILVVSHSSKLPSPVLELTELARHKVYGDTALSFYKLVP
jgi:16S rRNA (guanine966-N2)-methyltransferase